MKRKRTVVQRRWEAPPPAYVSPEWLTMIASLRSADYATFDVDWEDQ